MQASSHHSSALAHHFDSFEQQRESASLGMWLFVAQEIMFFGGIFTAYLVYRVKNPEVFALASSELDLTLGGINTVVLILSSLTMALAVREAQLGRGKGVVSFLIATLVFGGIFLGIKSVEYSAKFEHHLVPGEHFHFAPSQEEMDHLWETKGFTPEHIDRRAEMFFSIYFAMTGLHAFHMIIGMVILLFFFRPAWRGRYNADYHNPIECFGLYWHFVDIVWIFLFPMLYLIGRA
ncbi:MAG: cytochrome c oxidase subunit 3 family protein [Deltaproteobacteria bacterium]|nr:cytochrome c oxidase subunit 3 family protein [Deltaproteobacteria bacterium]